MAQPARTPDDITTTSRCVLSDTARQHQHAAVPSGELADQHAADIEHRRLTNRHTSRTGNTAPSRTSESARQERASAERPMHGEGSTPARGAARWRELAVPHTADISLSRLTAQRTSRNRKLRLGTDSHERECGACPRERSLRCVATAAHLHAAVSSGERARRP